MKTVIENVIPRKASKPVRLDEWRWAGVLDFGQYLAHIERAESARAAQAYTAKLYVPNTLVVA